MCRCRLLLIKKKLNLFLELVDIDNDPSFEGCINHFNIFEKKRKIVVYVKGQFKNKMKQTKKINNFFL